jgi:CIC family chloride channel protein
MAAKEGLGGAFGVFGPANLVLLPAIGGLMVGPLVQRFAHEARGHGVPEVMTAIAVRGARIRRRVVAVKVVASSLTIGFGGCAGREGPMIQIGSAIGSAIGQAVRLPVPQLRTLVACGAAGGIAATFNAPIAGAIFSFEVLMGRTRSDMLLVLLTSLSSCLVARWFLGDHPAFLAPSYELVSGWELPAYFALGLLAGTVAIGYVRLLYRAEDVFAGWRAPDWVKPAVGGLAVGVLLRFVPQIYGSGFPAIESALWVRLSLGVLAADVPQFGVAVATGRQIAAYAVARDDGVIAVTLINRDTKNESTIRVALAATNAVKTGCIQTGVRRIFRSRSRPVRAPICCGSSCATLRQCASASPTAPC